MTCWADIAERQHLARIDAADAREAEIERRVDALTDEGAPCYPWQTQAFLHAMNEVDCEPIALACAAGAYERAGRLMAQAVRAYWVGEAEKQAKEAIRA